MRSPAASRRRFRSRSSSRRPPSRLPSTICCTAVSDRYLYVSPRFDGVSVFSTDALAATSERHRVLLDPGSPTASADPAAALTSSNGITGVVIGLASGLPDRRRLELVARALDQRLRGLQRHRQAAIALEKVGRRAHTAMKAWERIRPGLRWIYRGRFPVRRYDILSELERMILDARPVPFTRIPAA